MKDLKILINKVEALRDQGAIDVKNGISELFEIVYYLTRITIKQQTRIQDLEKMLIKKRDAEDGN